MKKISLLVLLLLSSFLLKAQYTLTDKDIEEYEEQVGQMVHYLQETLNFIGDPTISINEKDIIFKESYSKIFRDDKVQVEDDLDDHRGTSINKDVQAYLKDVDFFYDNIIFNFDVQSVTPQTNDLGETYFKVSMIRTIAGRNISGDTVNNSKNRYLEINLDPYKKELKIVSFYTTKPNEDIELSNWWNSMDDAWKKYLAKDLIIYDTLQMSNVSEILDDGFIMLKKQQVLLQDTFMVVDNDTLSMDRIDELYGHKPDTLIYINDVVSQWVNDTIIADMSAIYETLKQITKITDVNVSDNSDITNVNPLAELSELRSLNCSNTKVSDISPIRNLNKIKDLNISNTAINDISNLKYANGIQNLKADNVDINDISIVVFFKDLTNLSLSNTYVSDATPLVGCKSLSSLDLSHTKIDSLTALKDLDKLHNLNVSNNNITDLEPLRNLVNLNFLSIDSTEVSDLSPLQGLTRLNEINCSNTKVANLDPLKDLLYLNKIYCDNSLVTKEIASDFMKTRSNVLVINETRSLELWWEQLPSFWKTLLSTQNNTTIKPNKEELHSIINMKSLKLNDIIQEIEPIGRLTNLETLDLSNSMIDDLTPLYALHNLKYLNLENTKVSDLSPLTSNSELRHINIDKTKVTSLEPLYDLKNITMILAENSDITSEDVYQMKKRQRQVTIIYQTEELRLWWANLSSSWKEVFNNYVQCDLNPSAEQLQSIVDLEEIEIDHSLVVQTLEPLTQMMFLKKLIVNNNQIQDLTPLEDKMFLEVLSISGNPIDNIAPLRNLNALKEINLENTTVSDLVFLSELKNVKVLNISGTSVKNLKPLAGFDALEDLSIVNTDVRSITHIENLPSLKHLKMYKTKVKGKYVELLKMNRPELNVVYY